MGERLGFEYHRLIVGYHGCDRALGEQILLGHARLKASRNAWDWLGSGIYFWEHGPERALSFAREQQARGKVKEPFVLGAYIHLGRCLDLTDARATRQLSDFFPAWAALFNDQGMSLPENKAAKDGEHDLLLRFRDCAVLNAFLEWMDKDQEKKPHPDEAELYYQSVRGVFIEGSPVFSGSRIFTKTHTQIALRDPLCILGYFMPADQFEDHHDDQP